MAALLATLAALSGGAPTSAPVAAQVDCTVTAKLVNPCRPWLGVVADHYPGLSTWRQQYEGHEARIGRRVDVVHGYHPAGKVTLTSDERSVVQRGSILYLNWKPHDVWAQATGTNATVNAQIDTMAAQVKALPGKIMLALSGEPERYVTPGTSACAELRGNAGSPADYRAMWANVQARFAAAGVTNVVWVMNYLGFKRWDCLFPELWPGNDRIDWVVWDPYVGPGQRFDTEMGYFYEALERKTDATHAFTSKPWGLAEYGSWQGATQAEAYRMYDDVRAALDANRYPRLKLWEIYDTISAPLDIRVGYSNAGVADPTEQARYNAVAHHPIFTDPVDPPDPPDPPAPTDHLAACDTGVQTGISCFAGVYSGSVAPKAQTADGYQSTRSVQVTNTSGATGTFGLNVKPTPVASTVVGTTYSGGVWVRASRVGLPITLLLRERRADNTSPGYTSVTWTATDLQWHRITGTYVAKQAGNTLSYSVYASSLGANQWMRADGFGLTSVPAA